MKVRDLTQKQLKVLAKRPEWLSLHRPDLLAKYRPDWKAIEIPKNVMKFLREVK